MEKPIIVPNKLHPLLEMLPDYLKDTHNYFKIKKMIMETVLTNCGHDSIAKMAACHQCSANMLKRRAMLKKLGFKNPQQYHLWQKVHEKILELYPEMGFDDGTYDKKKYIKV